MEGRHLVREATLDRFREDPDLIHSLSHDPTAESALYPGFDYDGHAWGMAVDLNACTDNLRWPILGGMAAKQ